MLRGFLAAGSLAALSLPVSLVGQVPTESLGFFDGSSYVVPNACPGEYCTLGEWQVTEDMVLRLDPVVGSDSVGFVPALEPFCADSAVVVVDPVGLLAVTRPPPEDRGWGFVPAFARGDTVQILDYSSEGYWNVHWRDSIVSAYQYWAERGFEDQLVRPGSGRWWVHVTGDTTRPAGWILRLEWTGSTAAEAILVDGGQPLADRMFMRTTPPC